MTVRTAQCVARSTSRSLHTSAAPAAATRVKLEDRFFPHAGTSGAAFVDSGANLQASLFRYGTGVCGVRVANGVGTVDLLPFQGQAIWRASFHGQVCPGCFVRIPMRVCSRLIRIYAGGRRISCSGTHYEKHVRRASACVSQQAVGLHRHVCVLSSPTAPCLASTCVQDTPATTTRLERLTRVLAANDRRSVHAALWSPCYGVSRADRHAPAARGAAQCGVPGRVAGDRRG